jgi:hypothetical protein
VKISVKSKSNAIWTFEKISQRRHKNPSKPNLKGKNNSGTQSDLLKPSQKINWVKWSI